MWRTMNTIKHGNLRVHRSTHQQKDVGLLGRAGLPRIQGPRALVRHSRGSLTQIARSSVDQGDVGGNGAAGPLVPSPQQQNGHLPAVPGSDGGPSKVPVQFVVPEYLTHWGQVLKVVGSMEELGNWKVEKAPSMQWNEGHTWTLDVQLPVGAVNFKIVMHDQPNSNVRWEMGDDRSVLIPETTTVTGAPVGQVGVTCNFNDVHNSRVEVRPDRAYLKQQLKAVEARVVAIQEKKRKLDQRMSVLTDGLKKYDATVALLQTGVQAAVEARRSSKESAAQQKLQQPAQQQQAPLQQPAEAAEQPAGSSNGVPVPDQQQQEQEAVPAAFNPLGRRESIQVPIIDPSQLPSFGDIAPAAAADELAAFSTDSSSVEDSTEELQEAAAALSSFGTTTSSSDSSDSSALIASYIPDVSAIKASHVNETVLSATVDQLLAAAEDALARSGGSSGPGETPLLTPMSLGVSGVNDVQLAEEYVEELLAAASALEQQADRRASLLLEAAKHTGDSDMAADIEQLAAAELPPIPTVEELAAEAAATAIDSTLSFEESSSSSMDSVDQGQLVAAAAAAAPAFEDVPMAEQQQPQQQPPEPLEQREQVVVEAAQPQQQQQQQEGREGGSGPAPAARALDRDGSITFSAESLNVDVDVKQLLASVLNRVGIPLTGQVTISATYTPNTPATDDAASTPAAAAAADKMESAAEVSLDHNMDTMAAAVAAAANDGPVQTDQTEQQQQQEGQQQQNRQQQQQDRRPPLSPVDAIAAVFSRGNSMDSDDESGGSSSSRSGSGGSSSSRGFGVSAGSNGAKVPTQGNNRRYSRAAAVQAVAGSSGYSSAAVPVAATTGGEGRPPAVRLDAREAALQLEAKEAARRAAAERVAAALAQVEEMRRSVVAANSLLKQQLHGSSDSGDQQSSSSSSSSRAIAPGAGNDSISSSSGSVFSKYRVSYKGGRQAAAAGPAADTPQPDSSSSVRRQGSGAAARSDPVSAPGASRGLPAIGATAVTAALQPVQGPVGGGLQQQQQPEVEGELKEELSLLAALAAEVAKQGRSRRQ